MMNILFVVNRCKTYIVNSGGALRNNLFLRALTELGHVDVISFWEDNLESNITNSDVLYSEVIGEKGSSRLERLHSLIKTTLWPNDPYSFFYKNEEKATIIDTFVKKKKYDIIACRYFDTVVVCGLLKYKNQLVIDVDDNPSNMLKIEAARISSFIFNKYELLYKSRKIKILANGVLDKVLCSFCSNQLELPSPHTIFLPNTSVYKASITDTYLPTKPKILFVGGTYYPNRHGISHFVEKIFPLIRKSVPSVELKIVGQVSPTFSAYLNEKDGVNAVGRVDDLEKEYREAAVVVIPIYYGTGTSVKFIEALLMNRPVVSTPVGARGFDGLFQDGVHYMLANNDDEFAEKTVTMLSSLSKSREIAKKGFELADKYYSTERFIKTVKSSILEIR